MFLLDGDYCHTFFAHYLQIYLYQMYTWFVFEDDMRQQVQIYTFKEMLIYLSFFIFENAIDKLY
mgnify:CR=1 FL=1